MGGIRARVGTVLVLAAGLLGSAGATVGAPAARAANANAYMRSEAWLRSADGTPLHADVMLPANRSANERHPVILSIGPYFAQNYGDPNRRFSDLWDEGRIFERGYAYVQVDSRGYGQSGGCSDFGGPGEQSDTKAAVEWAAAQPWSSGRVGMWGKSYDAWTQVMALAQEPQGLAAAVIQAPLLETYRGLFMHGVHYDLGWYGTAPGYARFDLDPQKSLEPQDSVEPLRGTATNPACYAENQAFTPVPDRSMPYWRARDIVDDAAASDVPVLWSHGFNDVNTKPDNILDVYGRLSGPKRAWFGQWDHVRGNQAGLVGRKGFMSEAMAWFDHHLKDIAAPALPAVEIQDGDGRWRTEQAWPPADAVPHAFPLAVAPLQATAGVGGLFATTATPPAPHDLHLSGEAHAAFDVTSHTPGDVMVKLYDQPPTGQARLITQGARAFTGPGRVEVELFPQDWLLKAGHRLVIDVLPPGGLFQPSFSGAAATVSGGSLVSPFLRYQRTYDLEGGPAAAQVWVERRTFGTGSTVTVSGTTFPPPLQPSP